MGFFDRLFGRKQPSSQTPQEQSAPAAAEQPAAPQPEAPPAPKPQPPAEPSPLRLQVLFPQPPKLDGQRFVRALERLHRSMLGAKLEVEEDASGPRGRAVWGRHVIEILVRNHPMPREASEPAIGLAHYRNELKDQARAHRAYLLLNYRGKEESPWAQYAALAAAASIFIHQGATTIVNSDAVTSAPASALSQVFGSPDAWGMLLAMPPTILYCGFAKYTAPDGKGVWMRTHGCHLVGLPDLAYLAADHSEGERVVNIFNAVITEMRSPGNVSQAGSTIQITPHVSVRLREPTPEEPFKESGALLVLESMSLGDNPAMTSI